MGAGVFWQPELAVPQVGAMYFKKINLKVFPLMCVCGGEWRCVGVSGGEWGCVWVCGGVLG